MRFSSMESSHKSANAILLGMICLLAGCAFQKIKVPKPDYLIEEAGLEDQDIQIIAVFPADGDPNSSETVADELSLQCEKWSRFEAVERARVQQAIEDSSMTPSRRFDETAAREIGKLVGADGVVLSSFTDGTIHAWLVSVENGDSLWKAWATAQVRGSFTTREVIETLSEAVCRSMGGKKIRKVTRKKVDVDRSLQGWYLTTVWGRLGLILAILAAILIVV